MRRVRVRRHTATMLAGGLLLTGALAGCGDDGGKPAKKAGGATAASKPSPAASEQGTQAVRAAYQKTADAKTAKMTIDTQVQGADQQATAHGSGVIDLSNGSSDLTLTAENQKLQQRTLNGVIYQQPPTQQRSQLPQGKSWIKIDLEKLARQSGGSSQYSDPAQSFSYVKGINDKDVTKAGNETIDGAKTTHYKVSVDVAQLAKGQSAADVQKLKQQLGDSLPLDIWLDDEGRMRQEKVSVTATPSGSQSSSPATNASTKVVTTVKFSDFGTDVKVTAPAAKDTVDITAKAAQQKGTSA
ncbi:hypothetical protein HY68_37215 [Streptomyces sp. AcH 505]|uniref:hypothetical protein n=1 Tax=Streptomyces sp. AcH 505 TaxID=352211 RepID=UPI000591BEE4|nr:hypothetical protein HY68_37215 [Streptomyces sp. AcH 505]